MEASKIAKAGPRPSDTRASSADTQRRRAALARFLRMGVSDGAKSPSADTVAMSELETELALLREENAQLKVERHRPADAGHVIERMRSLRPRSPAESQGEGSTPPAEFEQTLAECLATRNGLMDACQEVQQAMQGIRGRLSALAGNIHSNVDDRSQADRLPRGAEAMGVEPAVLATAESSPELAQSVA